MMLGAGFLDGRMVVRRAAASFLDAEKSYRKIMGYRDVRVLKAHLDELGTPVLGAHYLSGFVAHSLSGSEPSPRRLNEPDGDAAGSADGSIRKGL